MIKQILQINLNTFRLCVAVVALLFGTMFLGSSVLAQSSISDSVCRGILSTEGTTPGAATTSNACVDDGNESFSFLVKRVINVFSIVVGAVSVIMIIIGGFRYVISGGDSAGVSSAKNTIMYAIIGLVIVIFAQVIVRFVFTNVTQNRPTTQPNTSQTP